MNSSIQIQHTLENMSDGLVVLDSNWNYTVVNKKAAELFGCTSKDLIGKNIWEIYPEAIGQPFYKNYFKAIETKQQINFEDYYKPWDRWFENRVIPTNEGLIILFQDITFRKKHELEIIENAKFLSNSNQKLNDFCNIVSHNLRAPLVNISLITDLIESSQDTNEKIELVNKIKPVVNHLNEVFNELVESLQVQHEKEIQFDCINIKQQFHKTLEAFQPEIKKNNVKIISEFEIENISYPLKYFNSFLSNLISNALKYRSLDRDLEIKIKIYEKEGQIIMSVSDNGLGIDLLKNGSNMFKIRKVFHHHPDARGFGLFMTKTQVEAMGGKIWVESFPNIGSTFYISF